MAYPLVVEGGFTVVAKDPITKKYDAHFGMILTENPMVCHKGYEGTDRRPPQNTGNRAHGHPPRCTEPATQSNARGAQHAPRAADRLQVAGRRPVRPGDRQARLDPPRG